jgi:hypothetical protein
MDGIRWYQGRGRDIGQGLAIGAPEAEGAVGRSLYAIALLVHRAVVAAAEECQVPERRRPAFRPVAEVMPLGDPDRAAREAAAPVPVLEGAPQGRRDRPRPGPDLDHPPIGSVAHHHAAGIAAETAGRFRGNARALLQD